MALLQQKPSQGYELIRAIEERSNGSYVPSPGMVYPVLTYLEEIGHAELEPEGNRKLYRLTDAGRMHLDANRAGTEAVLDALGRIGSRMEPVREVFAGLDALDPDVADNLHQVSHALKQALMSARHCTPAEGRRIVAILQRTTLNSHTAKSGKQT